MSTSGQGQRHVFGAVVEGSVYPIPAGGSDDGGSLPASAVDQATALLETEEGGGTEEPPEDSEGTPQVQPDEGAEEQPSGQDLIAPYLEGLEGETRGIVEERLRRFQAEADSNANRKIQSLSEKLQGFQRFAEDSDVLEPVVDLYAFIMQEPEKALPWLVEALHTERGVALEELRDPLLEKLGIQQPPSGGSDPSSGAQEAGSSNGEEKAQPLTRQDLEQFFEERKASEKQERDEERRREEASRTLDGWISESLDKFKLTERIPADSPMRQFILQQANTLMQSRKVTNGRVAIESAVEQVAKLLDSQQVKGSSPSEGGEGKGRAPRTASGGIGAQVPDGVDLKDRKSRIDAAANLLAAATREE